MGRSRVPEKRIANIPPMSIGKFIVMFIVDYIFYERILRAYKS